MTGFYGICKRVWVLRGFSKSTRKVKILILVLNKGGVWCGGIEIGGFKGFLRGAFLSWWHFLICWHFLMISLVIFIKLSTNTFWVTFQEKGRGNTFYQDQKLKFSTSFYYQRSGQVFRSRRDLTFLSRFIFYFSIMVALFKDRLFQKSSQSCI